MKPFANQVALITGGTRGIGRAIAKRLAEEGCEVALVYLSDHDSAKRTLTEIESGGGRGVLIQCHLGDPQSRKEMWQQFDRSFQRLDFYVANAATGVFREATRLSLNSLKKVFAVNVEAFLEHVQEAVARMPERPEGFGAGERGRIVALSSMGAERVISNYASVGSSKAALEALVRQLAFELGSKGINCNTVRAGLVDTGVLNFIEGKDRIISDTIQRTPNNRLVHVDDVAALVRFVLSKDASMLNGQTLNLDGGFSLGA